MRWALAEALSGPSGSFLAWQLLLRAWRNESRDFRETPFSAHPSFRAPKADSHLIERHPMEISFWCALARKWHLLGFSNSV